MSAYAQLLRNLANLSFLIHREEFQDVLETEIESNWDQVVDKCV